MAVSGVLTSGQLGYPIQGLGSYGGAEEKQSGCMRFTCEHDPSLPSIEPAPSGRTRRDQRRARRGGIPRAAGRRSIRAAGRRAESGGVSLAVPGEDGSRAWEEAGRGGYE